MSGGNAPSHGCSPVSRALRTHALRAIAKAVTNRTGRKVVDATSVRAPHVSKPQCDVVTIVFNRSGKRKIVPIRSAIAVADLQA
jgi:hypothetical protein